MNEWYGIPWKEIVRSLSSNIHMGLKDEQVKEYRELYGDNKLKYPKGKHLILLLASTLFQLWSLCVCGIIASFCVKRFYLYSVLISVILLFSIIFMVYEKYEQQKEMKSFEKLNNVKAKVIRNGKYIDINSEEIVRGDIILLERGLSIPADIRIIESEDLRIKETSITGVDGIVEKYSTKIQGKDISLSEMKNIGFKTSVVVSGEGKGIVVTTGMNTTIGMIVSKVLGTNREKVFFEKGVNQILNIIAAIFIMFIILTMGFKFFITSELNVDMLNIAVNMLYAFPYGLILIVYLIWVIIKIKMKRTGISFKNISVMQSLSNINVVLENKVGFFTQKYCTVKKIYTDGKVVTYLSKEELEDNVRRLIEIGVLCNNCKVEYDSKGINTQGEMKDIALFRFGKEIGIDKSKLESLNKRIFEIPFDVDKRITTTVNRVDDFYRANVRGSVESMLKTCTHIMKNGIEKEITKEDILKIKEEHMKMASNCLYVIAVGYRNFNYEPSLEENIESNLIFVGLIGFENQIKEQTYDAIDKAKKMAIKPLIVAKDDKLTLLALGKKIKLLYSPQEVLSGIEMKYMSDKEVERIVEKVGAFSKISNAQKSKIINNLKKCEYNVLAMGSKLIDIPVLGEANIAISVGEKCSSIVKKLSDIFFIEKDFSKLIDLIEINRKLINIIKNIFVYIFMFSMSLLCLIISGYIFENKIILNNSQMLWLNLITVTIGSLTILSRYNYVKFSSYSTNVINKKIFSNVNIIKFVTLSIISGFISYLTYKYTYGNFNIKANNVFMVFGISHSMFVLNFISGNKKEKKFNIGKFLLMLNIGLIFAYTVIVGRFEYVSINQFKNQALVVLIFIIFQLLFGKAVKKFIVK